MFLNDSDNHAFHCSASWVLAAVQTCQVVSVPCLCQYTALKHIFATSYKICVMCMATQCCDADAIVQPLGGVNGILCKTSTQKGYAVFWHATAYQHHIS